MAIIVREYTTIYGEKYNLDRLSYEEREFLDEMFSNYLSGSSSWEKLSAEWIRRGRKTIWKGGKLAVGSPVYTICQDLDSRLGIQEGMVAPVNDSEIRKIKQRGLIN